MGGTVFKHVFCVDSPIQQKEIWKMSVKEGNVILVPVEYIEAHPNNPRKNVGDVTELYVKEG